MSRLLGRSLLLALILAMPTVVSGQGKDFTRGNPAILGLFRGAIGRASESTVLVKGDGKDLCLGVVVNTDGHLLTKISELKGKLTCRLKDGREVPATLIGTHEPTDLALLKIDAKGLKPIAWTDSNAAELGAWVASPGPGGDALAVGVISVASRKTGSRPGPTKTASGGYLGVSLDPDATQAKVAQILPNTPAEKAGLKVNDIVLNVDQHKIDDAEGLIQLLMKFKPGDQVLLKVKRAEKEMELKLTLSARPADRADFQNRLGSELSARRTGFPVILQHDSVLRARDCGGPLVDLEGRVIGLNIARAGRTESYAIPAEDIKPLIPELIAGKYPPPPELLETAAETRLRNAREAVRKAEADRQAVLTKLADLRAALEKAEADPASEKLVVELKASLTKLEAEKVSADKRLTDARLTLTKAELDARPKE